MIEEESTPRRDSQPPTVWWPIILALITAILTIIFSPYVAGNIVGAYSALIASLILGWLFTTDKYWRWSKTRKWVTRGVLYLPIKEYSRNQTR